MSSKPRARGAPTLVVLAAGMGSRYGGMKQLAAVGPSGESLIDYSVHDAARAGFGSVVFVIRPEMEAAFREFAGRRYGRTLPFTTVHQRLDDVPAGTAIPAGRVKPWGTGQAVLAAEPAVSRSFAIVNADDFYGAEAYAAIAEFLRASDPLALAPVFGLVGYRIADTLSESGGVNRGVLRVADDGSLASIEEVIGIRRTRDGLVGSVAGERREVGSDALVSMNMWGFTPAVFPILRAGFRRFLAGSGTASGEFLLPTAIQDAISRGEARVHVLDPRCAWFGITYPSDAPAVSAALVELIGEGRYPSPLLG